MASPVLVLIKSTQCGACQNLARYWPSIVARLKSDYPTLRFVTYELDNMRGMFDESKVPAGLSKFMSWFPMILLVPGALWDSAIAQLSAGKNNKVDLTQGTQVLNGVNDSGRWTPAQPMHYNPSDPDQMSSWVGSIINTPEFKPVDVPKPNILIREPPTQAAKIKAPQSSSDICRGRYIPRPPQ
jgi:hypothetical protein